MAPIEVHDAKRASSHAPGATMSMELSTSAFRIAWFIIITTHISCAVYMICFAMTYRYLATDTMKYYVLLWSETGNDFYSFYGAVFSIVGGMHALQVLHLLVVSIRSKRLMLSSDTISLQISVARRIAALSNRHISLQPSANILPSIETIQVRTFASRIWHIWAALFSRHGIFGVESEHFTMVFAAREVLEVSSQTYQTYRASYLLPRVGLNSFLIALLITSCWSTAAIQYALRKSPSQERVASLGMDALISIGMTIVVPLVIFIPYVEAFDLTLQAFYDQNYMFDPTRVAILALEIRLIFVAGTIDFCTKLIPQISIFLSLVAISTLITRVDAKVFPENLLGSMPMVIRSKAIEGVGVGISDVTPTKSNVASPSEEVQQPPASSVTDKGSQLPKNVTGLRLVYKWRHEIAIVIFCAWGVILSTLHILAMNRAARNDPLGCRAITRPWFSNGLDPCSSLVYDCNQRGTTSLNETSFDALDHVALASLAIVHCPELRMPSVIQNLTGLKLFYIYNVTIVEWAATSSISATQHASLISVLIGRTNMTAFPPGLLEPLPVSLQAIMLSGTNLTTIPDNLHERWDYVPSVLSFENGILTEVPYQLFLLPVYVLSLQGNRLETIPTLAMIAPGNYYLNIRLKKNPLRELPATLTTPGAFITDLNIQETKIASLPAWVMKHTMSVYLHGTPYCETVSAESLVAPNAMCTLRPAVKELDYPTEMIAQMYPLGF